jgi:transposase InsO family protein
VEQGIAMEGVYRHLGVRRQTIHKRIASTTEEQEMMKKIGELAKRYRREKDRRAGSRSLFYNLEVKKIFGIGVTKFEQLMSAHGMTLSPLQVRVITTQSSLQSWNYSNLIEGLEVQNINQLVVGDLTYITYSKDRFYLFCLTDVYSARIVGHCFSTRMRSSEAQSALDKWTALREKKKLRGSIHHTDGGSQYFSRDYLRVLKELGIQVSVAQNCLENGYAEQRNGLIKYHLIPTIKTTRVGDLAKEIDRIIDFYNSERKQDCLGWRSPVEFEQYIRTVVERPKRVIYSPETNQL